MKNILGTAALVVAVVAIILAGTAVYLNREVGPTGPQGNQGIPGAQGIPGINGTQGPKGNNGSQGPRGPSGSQGPKGDSAPINEPPKISLISVNNTYYVPPCHNYHKHTYNITVFVDDPENDNMQVTFYYSYNTGGPWNDVSTFFGHDGNYSATTDLMYTVPAPATDIITCCHKPIYWLVEAWDGSDITTATYNCTITPLD
jgi:hypothetical protein